MVKTASGSLVSTISWVYQNADDIATTKDVKEISHSEALASGTGNSQMDVVHRARVTPTNATPVDIDLTALTDVFGEVIDFQTIRAIHIENKSTTTAENILVGPLSEATPFITPWNDDADAANTIGPSGVLALSSPIDGFDQGGGALRISTTVVAGVNVDIVLLGVKT